MALGVDQPVFAELRDGLRPVMDPAGQPQNAAERSAALVVSGTSLLRPWVRDGSRETLPMTGWTGSDMPHQGGRVVVVTGANSGLGLEVARAMARRGAAVIMACRNAEKGQAAARAIRSEWHGANPRVRCVDLADLRSVESFGTALLTETDRIDVLVNNAGVMGTNLERTAQGIEAQLGVNHIGAFALTLGLLPRLTGTPGSRVVAVSSMAHRWGRIDFDDISFDRRRYDRWVAYGQSKLANLLFTRELQRRLTEAGARTTAVAAHPGFARTDLGSEGNSLGNRVLGAVMPGATQSARMGALPILRAATFAEAEGGAFYGPRYRAWGHPVRETPARRARDDESARRLWHLSAELAGLGPDITDLCRANPDFS